MAEVEIRFGSFTDDDLKRIASWKETVSLPRSIAKRRGRKAPSPTAAAESAPQGVAAAPSTPRASSSWSGLFGGKAAAASAPPTPSLISGEQQAQAQAQASRSGSGGYTPKVAPGDVWAALMSSLPIDFSGKSCPLQLHGLFNEGNTCFMNAPLQMLLACDALRSTLVAMEEASVCANAPHGKAPLLSTLTRFSRQFKLRDGGEERGDAVSAGSVYAAARTHQGAKELAAKGTQHDAEEFLGFILSTLHDETSYECESEELEEEDEWAEVGEGNKVAAIHENKIKDSPIARIFRGTFRSTLHIPGSKKSVTLQPFFSLQLDIQNPAIVSIEDAIELSLEPEHLHDVKAKNQLMTTAMRALSLESLPPVLVLHLKRFQFDEYGCQKISKYVRVPLELELSDRFMSVKGRAIPHADRKYSLVSVIDHHGAHSEGGHYTCSALTPSGWLLFDDNKIYPMSQAEVVRKEQYRQAYILVYKQVSSTSS